MKPLLTLLLILFTGCLQAQKITPLDSALWNVNYDAAMVEAKHDNHNLIIVFSGSDWCKPCIKLHENVLVTQAFSNWAKDTVVLLMIDFPRQKKNQLPAEQIAHNERIAEKYNPDGIFPLVLVITGGEAILGQLYYHDENPDQYILKLKEILNNGK